MLTVSAGCYWWWPQSDGNPGVKRASHRHQGSHSPISYAVKVLVSLAVMRTDLLHGQTSSSE